VFTKPKTVARCASALLATTLVGCASLPQDWGRADVASATAARGRPLPSGDTQSLSNQLLAQPLTPDSAITLALIHNPAVRETTARLGFASADVYDAARIANPVFSASRLASTNPTAVSAQIGLGIAFSFTDLLLLPARSHFAEARFEAVKLEVGAAAMRLASDAETAWYRLAGAEQTATLRAKVSEAADASATLAQRYFDAGNINKRELAMEKAAAAQAQLDVLSAQADAQSARSSLNRIMGLPATQSSWTIAGGLPAPLTNEDSLDGLLKLATESRLDVAGARKNAEAIANAYGLERKTRLLGPIEIGYDHEKETDGSSIRGPSLSWAIPLFNWGSGRVARAQAELDRAEAELSARELDASNDVQATYTAMIAAKALAERYRTQLIPQREAVVEQAGRELNYMLIGAFDVILVKQQEYDAYAGYLKVVRDYWVARTELTRAVGRRLPSSDQTSITVLDAQQLTTPKNDGGMGHMGHSMKGMQMPGMEDMDMRDMDGMDMSNPEADKAEAPAKVTHSGHSATKPAGRAKNSSPKKTMPSMPGMDHSGHDMPGMKGMDMPAEEMPVKQSPELGHESTQHSESAPASTQQDRHP
jgi:cobalt-zinc-cadmium efflux system outer membrane protein